MGAKSLRARRRWNLTRRKLRAARRKAGLCHYCGQPAELRRSRCAKHRKEKIESERRLRRERRRKGLCEFCDNRSRPGRVDCPTHSARRSAAIQAVKLKVLAHYGKRRKAVCCWPGCDEADPEMLTLDHVHDDGAEYRRKTGVSGKSLYSRLKSHGWPTGYQTLCWGHQWKKEIRRRRAALPFKQISSITSY